MRAHRFWRPLIKTAIALALTVVLAVAGTILFYMWSVTDLPSKVANIEDCKTEVRQNSRSPQSDPAWRTKAVFVIESNGDNYLAGQIIGKFASPSHPPTFTRQLKQLALMLLLKISKSQQERSDTLLRISPFSGTVNGINCAALQQYHKPTNLLSIGAFATLIGQIKGPSIYDPKKYPEEAVARRNIIIDLWQEAGLLNEQDAVTAKSEALP